MTFTNTARLAACPIADGGTPTGVWAGWDLTFSTLDVAACPTLVIAAPHPDDETLGLGATAAMMCDADVDVHVVSVSDGGAAFPGDDAAQRTALESLRRDEVRCATAILGTPEPTRLGLPDGELARHEHELVDRLCALLEGLPAGTWCAATWRGDGHPDHEAVGRAAAVATQKTGAVLIEYPVWMWHWATPRDAAVPWHRARRVPLYGEAMATKTRAVQCFSSQLEPAADSGPVLPAAVVQRLLSVGEVVFV